MESTSGLSRKSGRMSDAELTAMTKILRVEDASLLKCRVALLTSLYFAGLKAWEATETIHLGIAGIFQVGRVDYTTRKRNPEANWDDPSHQCSDLRRP